MKHNCTHFHKGALACKLNSLPCTKILWKGNPCSSFELPTKKKKADSKVKKVSVIKESKIKKQDKKENNIKKKQIPIILSNPILSNEDLITDIKNQISLTLMNHSINNISNQQLFNKLQMHLTLLHQHCIK